MNIKKRIPVICASLFIASAAPASIDLIAIGSLSAPSPASQARHRVRWKTA